jgi:Domain of unknown function (DUF4272)
MVPVMRDRTAEQVVAQARLRPAAEILDPADLIYRYHWAVMDARVAGCPHPPVLRHPFARAGAGSSQGAHHGRDTVVEGASKVLECVSA